MADRAVTPVVAVVLLTAVTVVGATAVGAALTFEPPTKAPTAAFEADADATGTISVTHRGGDAVDPDSLRVTIRVDGDPLDEQPPVPFFSAAGFESGPTGAFNSATQDHWRAGETATLTVAGTNEPSLTRGSSVELRLYVEDVRLALLEVTVQAASTASAVSSAASSGT